MKKFDRLPPEQRKDEIQKAATGLFAEKGFAATTMENIVERVSLSKGGVYRIYPSTTAILHDLMLNGMRLRNAFYAGKIQEELESGRSLTIPFLASLLCDSLLLYPEISAVYVEFLWEKRRNQDLETLYQQICMETMQETQNLIQKYGADTMLLQNGLSLEHMTDWTNAAILSLHILRLQDTFQQNRERILAITTSILSSANIFPHVP